MLKRFAVFSLIFLSLAAGRLHSIDFSSDFSLGLGYRQDHFDWHIGLEHDGPNVLSELKWKDLQMFQVSGTLRALLCNAIYFRGKADYATIFHGSVTDTDFEGRNRTFPYLKSKSSANKGEAFDLSAGLGYEFTLFCERFTFCPLAGYSLQEQHLRMYNGRLLLDADDPDFQPFYFSGLHSNYRAKWYTPWVGFDVSYTFDCDLVYYGEFEYHWGNYKGTGHWNMRDEFTDDFDHSGRAHGGVFTFGAKYPFGCCWTAGVEMNYQYFQVTNGRDRTYFHGNIIEAGSPNFSVDIPLKKVHWHSFALMGTASCFF